jgi:hypothetical protein
MRPAIRRETLIALRATRTAHQIAREVLNPPINPAESGPHGTAWNEGVLDYARPLGRHAFSRSDWIWVGIATLVAVGTITVSTWLFS